MKTRFPLTYLFLRLSLCNYMLYMHNVANRSVSYRTLQHPGCNLYLSPCLHSQTQQLIIFLAAAGLWQSSSTSEVTGFLSGQFVNSCFCSVYPGIIQLCTPKTSWYTLVLLCVLFILCYFDLRVHLGNVFSQRF